MRLDPRRARGQTCGGTDARPSRPARRTQRDAPLNSSLDDVALGARNSDGLNVTPARAIGVMLGLAFMAGAMALGTQALAQPQPVPRPRELRLAPAPSAPASPPDAQERQTPLQPPVESTDDNSAAQAPVARSRAEWRAIHRACGEEWSRMMKAGQTTGLIWVDFFETCQKRP